MKMNQLFYFSLMLLFSFATFSATVFSASKVSCGVGITYPNLTQPKYSIYIGLDDPLQGSNIPIVKSISKELPQGGVFMYSDYLTNINSDPSLGVYVATDKKSGDSLVIILDQGLPTGMVRSQGTVIINSKTNGVTVDTIVCTF